MKVVPFKLGASDFAVGTECVKTIINMVDITKVPKAKKHIAGLINRRGNVNYVLDLEMLLNMPSADHSNGFIMILEIEDECVGICVDKVFSVFEYEQSDIHELPETDSVGLLGLLEISGAPVIMLDINSLLLK